MGVALSSRDIGHQQPRCPSCVSSPEGGLSSPYGAEAVETGWRSLLVISQVAGLTVEEGGPA